jgi:hypothetical protein
VANTQILQVHFTERKKGEARIENWIDHLAFAPLYQPNKDLAVWTDLSVLRALESDEARIAYLSLAYRASVGELSVGREVVWTRDQMLTLCGAQQAPTNSQKTNTIARAVRALVDAGVLYDVVPGKYTSPWRFRIGRAMYASVLARAFAPELAVHQRAIALMLSVLGVSAHRTKEFLAQRGTEELRDLLLHVLYTVENPRRGQRIDNPAALLVKFVDEPDSVITPPEFYAWRERQARSALPASASGPSAVDADTPSERDYPPLMNPTDDGLPTPVIESLRLALDRLQMPSDRRARVRRMLDDGRLVRDAVDLRGVHWIPSAGSELPIDTTVAAFGLELHSVLNTPLILQAAVVRVQFD